MVARNAYLCKNQFNSMKDGLDPYLLQTYFFYRVSVQRTRILPTVSRKHNGITLSFNTEHNKDMMETCTAVNIFLVLTLFYIKTAMRRQYQRSIIKFYSIFLLLF